MINDTGFKHLRVKVVAPVPPESISVLDRLFENPDVSTTLVEAGFVDGRPFFEHEIFGVGSKVDEALGPDLRDAADVRSACPEPQELRV